MSMIFRAAVLVAVFFIFPLTVNYAADARSGEVRKILADYVVAQSPVWEYSEQIAKLASTDDYDFSEELKQLAATLTPEEKVVVGGALLIRGEEKSGSLTLEAIILDENAAAEIRQTAATVMSAFGGGYAIDRLRFLLSNKALPDLLQISVAQALWNLASDPEAKERLKKIAFADDHRRAAIAATLVLGQTAQYDSADENDPLRSALRKLAQMPDANGAQAKLLIALDDKNLKNTSQDSFIVKLLTEIVEKIRTRYAFDNADTEEAEAAKPERLATSAARSLVRSLDDFSDYLDADDYQEMLNSMHGDYGGIGAYVGMRGNLFVVLTPMWGKPAQKAGLQAMDVITKIDEIDIAKMPLDKIIKRLKGPPDTSVRLTVLRKSFVEPQEFVVKREVITLPMMFTQELPGNIGYIRLTGFQEDPQRRISTSSELKRALVDFKKKKAKGVVLDLRNNPGGLLSEAVAVCENFLSRNQLIVYSKGAFQPRRNYVSKIIGEPTYTGPVVVLVNGGSASASEIVAGALRDHKRATLVGEKTFGKGSVQMMLPLDITNGATKLKLTIAKYYLPMGESIHGRDKGIKPHLEVVEKKFSDIERELRITQIENRDVSLWLEENFDRYKDEFMALLEYDADDPEKYPGFDEIYHLLTDKYPELKLDRGIVRKELRSNLFAFLRESRGIENYPVDIEESEALQRGILALGEKIGGLPDIPVYNAFKNKWKDEPEKSETAEVGNRVDDDEEIIE